MTTILIGGYRHAFKPSTVGRWGCDPCDCCGHRPAEGDQVWTNCYADLWCDDCVSDYAEAGSGGL